MLEAIAVWTGAVVGIVVVLLMALGPVIVEVDSWWYERRMNRRARKVANVGNVESAAPGQARRELARV